MTPNIKQHEETFGQLAVAYCGKRLRVQVLSSHAGFYIGTADQEGPVSRESLEYFQTRDAAELALAGGSWTQKRWP